MATTQAAETAKEVPPIIYHDVKRLAAAFRCSWWGHRLIYFYAGLFFVLYLAAGTYFQSIIEQPGFYLRPRALAAYYLGLLSGYSLYKTTRNDASDFPIYIAYWIIFPFSVLFADNASFNGVSLVHSPCLRQFPPTNCSGEQIGATIEQILYLPLAVVFLVSWVIIAMASVQLPGVGTVGVFRTEVTTKKHLNPLSRLRPLAITVLFALPVLALVAGIQAASDALLLQLFPMSDATRQFGNTSAELWIVQMLRMARIADDPRMVFAITATLLADVLVLVFGLRLARRLALRWSGRYWENDEAPPILLLRSFADDEAKVRPSNFLRIISFRKLRLEEALAKELARRGTLVAIGQPGERLPKLGAHRLYFSDADWQTAVQNYIEKSAFVVVIGGVTPWVRWELEQIVRAQHQNKLIFVVPPGSLAEKTKRLAVLSDVLGLSRTQQDEINGNAERLMTLSILGSGRVLACLGNQKRQNDFELASYFAMLAKGFAHA